VGVAHVVAFDQKQNGLEFSNISGVMDITEAWIVESIIESDASKAILATATNA
jgi:hypothetical protein